MWDDAHRGREWGTYPSEHLVRFVARKYYHQPNRRDLRFVDLGCGAGASTRFLAREGFSVTAIDRSRAAIDRLEAWLAGRSITGRVDPLDVDLATIDLTANSFDCVIDICSLQHVREPLLVIGRAFRWLKPGGRMFSIWASENHSVDVAEMVSPCIYLTSRDVDTLFGCFGHDNLDVEEAEYTDGKAQIAHYLISATKT